MVETGDVEGKEISWWDCTLGSWNRSWRSGGRYTRHINNGLGLGDIARTKADLVPLS